MATAIAGEPTILAVAPEGDGSATVTVERYYVQAGAQVQAGQPVALLRSEQFVYDLPAGSAGIVAEFVVPVKGQAQIGSALLKLRIAEHDHRVSQAAGIEPGRPRATPLARKLAAVHRQDLSKIAPSAADGRIRAADLRALVPELAAYGKQHEPQRNAKPAGAAPACSRQPEAIPRALTAIAIDLGPADGRVAMTPAILIIHAALEALGENRVLNSRWTEQGIVLRGSIDLGLAPDGRPGELALEITDAAALSPAGLARTITQAQADNGVRLDGRQPDGNPSFVVVDRSRTSAWWAQPDSSATCGAILCIGSIAPRAMVIEFVDGPAIALRWRALLTLAYDVRYITHVAATRFLQSIERRVRRQRGVC
jgi:pyruvate/2-oxoglutarate dehydrogenase complex dihydrolipoamide acyltransferase (E2) component